MVKATTQFDAYVMVDWSANNAPKVGKDSIWYCVAERVDGDTHIRNPVNPRTREAAIKEIGDIVASLAAQGLSTLVGFDFPFGYPAGLAGLLGIAPVECWKKIWRFVSERIDDDAQNSSNRFAVAADLNSTIAGRAFPFWGCPRRQETPFLRMKRPAGYASDCVPEFRITETRIRGPQSAWKLCYPGSVGSQALLGIARLWNLRFSARLSGSSSVWPFETGFELKPRLDRGWSILYAEIYPSIRMWPALAGECKDRAQVRGLAEYFACLDETGKIACLFDPPKGLSSSEMSRVVEEEGWILGVE